MIQKRIEGANVTFGAPGCTDLAVRRTVFEDGMTVCESAWELMPDEIETLKNGGSLVLMVWGTQPPVVLYVTPPSETFAPGDETCTS